MDAENSLIELARLAETARLTGSRRGCIQRRDRPDPATYIGSGKAKELQRHRASRAGADTVICDGELTPASCASSRRIVKVKVVDRTALILDIFAQHAASKEGKAQVELAQMQYLLPRLRGWGEIAVSPGRWSRGGRCRYRRSRPGETKIEIDRRRINARMAKLRKAQMARMQTARAGQARPSGAAREVPSVVLAGYTNAGKSSLLNRARRRRRVSR